MDAATSQKLKVLFATKLTDAMRMYLDTCARCGVCIEACHVYASQPQIRYSAVGRAEVIRKVFKKYFRLQGKIAPWLGEVLPMDDATIAAVSDAAWSCTGCRRCMVWCPFGIDTQMLMSIAKLLLIGADKEPKLLTMLADMSIAKGESAEETKADYDTAVANLAPEIEGLWPAAPGKPTITVGAQGVDVLYVALAGKHSIVSAAAIMNAAGEKWTLSRFEAVNFGAFLGDPKKTQTIARRIHDEAIRLQAKEVAIVECGTAFRVMKYLSGYHPFRVVAFVELIARYLREGRIRLDRSKFSGTLTYHDPCQIARNGGVIEEPRYVIRSLTDRFVELTPNRENNWCCGGGGGLVALGEKEFRMSSSRVKADQMKNSGADVICTACENCHTQLTDLNEHYRLGMKVEFLSHLAANALQKP
ncbi:MAG TPA: (Fe-S)-binding protein [Spirochaetia bacterium]|nr:(Fe-S)-binding protein [Spirochaetia bacterium]